MRTSLTILSAWAAMTACATTSPGSFSDPAAPAVLTPAPVGAPASALGTSAVTTAAPATVVTPPTAPPAVPPPPPPATAAPSDGQWVYTVQYGWTWMPYASTFTYVPAEVGATPLMYVYTPIIGWRWVSAPWVWGLGPRPWFAAGPERFVWYGRPWLGHPWYGFRGGYGHRPLHVGRHG